MGLKLLEGALGEYNRVNSDKVIAFRTRLYENFHNTTIFEQLGWEVKFGGNLHTRTTRIVRDGFPYDIELVTTFSLKGFLESLTKVFKFGSDRFGYLPVSQRTLKVDILRTKLRLLKKGTNTEMGVDS